MQEVALADRRKESQQMKIIAYLFSLFVLPLLVRAAADLAIEVDPRDTSRSLLGARIEIPAKPGELILWYPKWIPGVHASAGPVQNAAGLATLGAILKATVKTP